MTSVLRFHSSLTRDKFLCEFWQKKPVVLRNAIDPSRFNLEAEELAGLACEEEVESRLIKQLDKTDWQLMLGPLDESIFAELPDNNWTLLVQDVDKHIPEVHALLDAFDFLPDWRIDDIMISYATDNGGVGPHTDNYDVFLMQAQGQRRWRLSEHEYTDEDHIEDCPLRVLASFDTSEDWTLNPGDVLYLPPRVAHWGTAIGECMTWSLGLRGPSQLELSQAWLNHVSEKETENFFVDNLQPGRTSNTSITETEQALGLQLIRQTQPEDNYEYRRWFGAFVTEAKEDFEIQPTEHPQNAEQLHSVILKGSTLTRHPWARIATIKLNQSTHALCFQGQCIEIDDHYQNQLQSISKHRQINTDFIDQYPAKDFFWELLAETYNQGLFLFDE